MMKTPLLTLLCSGALALGALAQDPTATATPAPAASPALEAAPSPSVAPTSAPAATRSAARAEDDTLEKRIERRVRERVKERVDRAGTGPGVDIDLDDEDFNDIGALAAIPIVGIIFGTLSLFGTPIFIVLVIMFFSYLKQRSLHRTVRMMVEKGQEVPAALFAPPPVIRARSDMRRGVILVMVGLGVMLFLAAVNDWEGGAWALGLIPFMIGAGYLAIWVMEGNKITFNRTATDNTGTDTPPPLA